MTFTVRASRVKTKMISFHWHFVCILMPPGQARDFTDGQIHGAWSLQRSSCLDKPHFYQPSRSFQPAMPMILLVIRVFAAIFKDLSCLSIASQYPIGAVKGAPLLDIIVSQYPIQISITLNMNPGSKPWKSTGLTASTAVDDPMSTHPSHTAPNDTIAASSQSSSKSSWEIWCQDVPSKGGTSTNNQGRTHSV